MPEHKRRPKSDTPTHVRAKQCADWRPAFLAALSANANVSAAARAAGVERQVAYRLRESDKDFAAAWEDAIDEACDRLEQEAWRRAVDGTDKPVYQGGSCVGTIRDYSDSLMQTLLKAHRPKKYRENLKTEISGPDGGPIETSGTVAVYIPDNGRG